MGRLHQRPPLRRPRARIPGGYTRSTGPVIGRFRTELGDGRIVGIAAPGGRVLVPPLEYDPAAGAALGVASGADPFIPVGPAGTVTAWAWVTEPRKARPLRQPFGWALIRIDGGDTALLHVVDTGGQQQAMRTGLRVRPRWRDASQRVGSIRDIECFVPEVTMLTAPARLEYRLPAGRALGRFRRRGRAHHRPHPERRQPMRVIEVRDASCSTEITTRLTGLACAAHRPCLRGPPALGALPS